LKTAKNLCLAIICLSLCACGVSNITPNEGNGTQDTVKAAAESEKSIQTEIKSDIEALKSVTDTENSQTLSYNFIPVLSEEDIDYMGIPYKDLTAEQFIQLWAQCTRECNVQRLYAISYCNDEFSNSEEAENNALKEYAETLLHLELMGRMLFCYSDVDLVELEDAPAGYYDNENAEELHYLITCKRTVYEQGEILDEFEEENWITLKKVDGYWKMGIRLSSSPYFF